MFRTAIGAIIGTISLAILAGVVTLPTILSPVLGIVSAISLATAVVGTCPMYAMLGVSSRSRSPGTSQ